MKPIVLQSALPLTAPYALVGCLSTFHLQAKLISHNFTTVLARTAAKSSFRFALSLLSSVPNTIYPFSLVSLLAHSRPYADHTHGNFQFSRVCMNEYFLEG